MLYRCPTTGQNVDYQCEPANAPETYEAVSCSACNRSTTTVSSRLHSGHSNFGIFQLDPTGCMRTVHIGLCIASMSRVGCCANRVACNVGSDFHISARPVRHWAV
jgi:hypothetical protein